MAGVVTQQFSYGRSVKRAGEQEVATTRRRQIVSALPDVVVSDAAIESKTSRRYADVPQQQHRANKAELGSNVISNFVSPAVDNMNIIFVVLSLIFKSFRIWHQSQLLMAYMLR